VLYLGAGGAVTVAAGLYGLLAAGSVVPGRAGWSVLNWLLCGLSCAAGAAILAAARRERHADPLPWYLLGTSQLAAASAAAAVTVTHGPSLGGHAPLPADLLALGRYLLLAAGAALLVWQRQRAFAGPSQTRTALARGEASLLDAAVIAVGAGLPWLALIARGVGDAPVSLPAKAAWSATATAALLAGAAVVGLLLSAGPRPRPASYYLLTGGLLVLLGGAGAAGLTPRGGADQLAGFSIAASLPRVAGMASSVLLGAAALHPSLHALAAGSDSSDTAGAGTPATRRRLALLAAASLLVPATLLVQASRGQAIDLVVAGAVAALLALLVARLAGLADAQRQAAVTDGLTGLSTWELFAATLTLEVAQAARSGHDLAVLVLDVDHFKRINHAYGHRAGDRVLRAVAARLDAASRRGDVVARYGGGQFAVLLRDTSLAALPATAERLRRAVGDDPVVLADGTWLAVSVSIGAAAWPVHAHSAEELVRVADQALAVAKRRGRHQVQVGQQTIGPVVAVEERGEDAVLAYLERLADQIDARLSGEEHSAAIARWARTVAEHLKLGPEARRCCELGGRLHDIGKVVVPDEILLKPGPLTEQEWAVLRRHPIQGARLVGLANGLSKVALVVRQHHERFDGRGYPDRRRGQDIRIEARIVSVCDAWAAMRSNRPYCPAYTAETARQRLLLASGSQFDPTVVDAFLELERTGAVGTFSRVRAQTASGH
jgi:diguanylate cyclase (GGDEF)-like protein